MPEPLPHRSAAVPLALVLGAALLGGTPAPGAAQASKAADQAVEGAKKTGQSVEQSAKGVGKTVSEGAKKTGKGVEDTAKGVGKT
ncbi:MAG: hypothetical protein ACREJR_07625, partial [Candidatus Rokuibacteriota bacterium]